MFKTADEKLYCIIKYILDRVTRLSENDMCLMLLYFNYLSLNKTNDPGVYVNILVMKFNKVYKYEIENNSYVFLLEEMITNPREMYEISEEDAQILDEVIDQFKCSGQGFEELVNMILHTRTLATKQIIDLPRILFFACRTKKEYPILLSRLSRMIEQKQ